MQHLRQGYRLGMADHTTPSDATRAEEAKEATTSADAGSPATEEEAAAADTNTVSPEVAASEKEANERGANVPGEGALP